jgi:hypothetical protein
MAKAVEWAERVKAWRESGQKAPVFCEDKGYAAKSLQWWATELKRRERSVSATRAKPKASVGRSAMVRVVAGVAKTEALVPEPSGSSLLIRVGRAEIVVRRGSDFALLRDIIVALAGGAR